MKQSIKAIVPRPFRELVRNLQQRCFVNYGQKAYSQEGEDLILERFLEHQSSGFYVDVGAHHPKRFSNTYRLYRRGWRGLNIDAIPGGMSEFRRVRPRDINIEAAVAGDRRELTFYIFNEPALNTFDHQLAQQHNVGKYKILREITLSTQPLSDLLHRHLPPDVQIDVLTVDVEGIDVEVLQSSDWSRYKPRFVLAECLGALTLQQASSSPVSRFLLDQGYTMVAKTMNTGVFKLTGQNEHFSDRASSSVQRPCLTYT